MRTHHRMPPIFSLSMLDVLCCGLGAVILLMILNYWDARRQAKALTHVSTRAGVASKLLDETQKVLSTKSGDLESSQKALRVRDEEIRAGRRENQSLVGQLRALEKSITDKTNQLIAAEKALAIRLAELQRSEQLRTRTQEKLVGVEADLSRQKNLIKTAEEKLSSSALIAAAVPELTKELKEARKTAAEREEELAQLKKLAESAGLKLADAEKQSRLVQIEADTLRKLLEERKADAGRIQRRLLQSENRFAGVDLGGKRVIFLVDISGSMGSVDAQTPDAGKWPEVCRNVILLLRSLREVEKFQIIIFSDEPQFLLGRANQWIDWDGARTLDAVNTALTRIVPKGNTDLYAAFDAAFRLRPQGLDAVYLFSDGLPNVGVGLPNPPPPDEATQAAVLGRYLRDTIRTRWNRPPSAVKIHAVGFFYESPHLGSFLWALTRENGGSFVGMGKP